jgi:hypothetical protein
MNSYQLKRGFSVIGIGLAVAVAPAGTAWATSHHKSTTKPHTAKKPKKSAKAVSGVAACPSAALLGSAVSSTYTGPTTEQAAEKGWVVCDYSAQGEIAVTVSLYTVDDPLTQVSANAAAKPKKLSGIGNAASHFGTIVFVQQDSERSFSVIDDSGNLTLSQTEAIAKAIVAH